MNNKEPIKEPIYSFVEDKEEVKKDIAPVKRKIAKTMEVTETFNYYDVLEYCMKMEKAVKDKEAEIEGMKSMIKAYRKELELIESKLHVNEIEKKYQLDKNARLQKESVIKEVKNELKNDEKNL